eukprot:SAG11_NODE_1736_length_4344_cov_1.763722_5_plen_91_part_00
MVLRATNVHFPLYRVQDGLLQKRFLGNNAEHVYAIVIPKADRDLQRAIILKVLPRGCTTSWLHNILVAHDQEQVHLGSPGGDEATGTRTL